MKSMDLLETIGSIRDKYILEAHSQTAAPKKRMPSKRLFLIAAIIAMMLLLVGCVAYILGLKDMYVGEYTHDAGFAGTQNSDMISLQGYACSPEYLAAKEWNEYLLSYDEDKSIIGKISNNPTNLDSKYTEYQVYTQEMCDKLEEISKKYDLKLHSVLNTVDQAELDYRVGGEFTSDNLSRGWAYIYEDGTFQFDGDVYLNNTQVLFQMRRSVKGTLDEVVLTIGNIEHYQESQYQTASGEPVMLAVGPTKGLIIADFEECFITVNVLGSYGIDITEEHLKYIADSINYSVLKNVITPDMRGDLDNSPDSTMIPTDVTNPVIHENTQHAENAWEQAKSKFEAILSGEDGFLNRDQAEGMTIAQFCESFSTVAEVDFRITQFALSDLDHDGTPELILWENINGVDDCGFLVIRYDGNGGAVGYEFSYRQLIDLKYDGTFGYSGGVANSGFATLVFNDKGWEYDIFGCVEENDSGVSFKWGEGLLSEDEYWVCAEKQSAKESIRWMPYPAEHYDLSFVE